MNEIWKDIPGFEGKYQASNQGRIRSLDRVYDRRNRFGTVYSCKKKGRVLALKYSANNAGYISVSIGAGTYRMLHRLVAMAFHGTPKIGQVVNHKNGVKTDNRAENLEWVSQRNNCVHSRIQLGHRGKKLTIDQVKQIIVLSNSGMMTKDIAQKFRITRHGVSGILTGRFWPGDTYPELREVRQCFPPKLRHKRYLRG